MTREQEATLRLFESLVGSAKVERDDGEVEGRVGERRFLIDREGRLRLLDQARMPQ